MHRSFSALPIILSLAVLLAACGAGDPAITLEKIQLDLGDVPNGQVIVRDVEIRNDGDAVLLVEGVSTSCGCTSATVEPLELAPGEGGTLHIELDSGAHGPELTGPLVRQVFIQSN
ncbi:MAG: DUF1573 domain-containing protein, partial [Candidatus Promineifilaceae bacterium]|nr:DUF1573 domain-containing protein [Candidatus Promineifilaceae bacterium]